MTKCSIESHGFRDYRRAIAVMAVVIVSAIALLAISSEEADAATSGTCGDDLTWELNGSELAISGTGDMYDYSKGGAPWYSKRGSIKTLEINGASSIGKQAFYGCSKLVSADLGDVASVGVKSFANCTALKTVDFDDSLTSIGAYAFYGCANLREIDLEGPAKTLRTIGSYAFYKCDSISEICVPSFVGTIGSKAFSMSFADLYGNELSPDPESLRGYVYGNVMGRLLRQPNAEVGTIFQSENLVYRVTATIPAEASVIGCSGTVKSLVVPDEKAVGRYTFSITGIGNEAFKDCRTLREVDLGSVEKIGSKAFYKCYAIRDVDFGDSLQTIGSYAFYCCYALGSVSLPDKTSYIGSKAFCKCYAIDSVDLGGSMKTIKPYAFAYCTNIESIEFPDALGSVGSKAFLKSTFMDNEGNVLTPNADGLRSKSFAGSEGILRQDAGRFTVTVVTEGEKGAVDVSRYSVEYGTRISTSGNVLTVAGYGQTVATPAPADLRYTYSFVNYTEGDTVIVSDWVVTAHFKPTAIPYSVVIKYMCDGAPILKDGVDIRVNSQGEWGTTFTYNYLDNPKFDTTMASKYTLLKGYVEQPPMLADQGETVSVLINENLTVIVFEFNKLGAYVQFHRQGNPVAQPVYETPEPYGEAHHATIAANDPTDAGKVIKVLITDNVVGHEAQGTFIGAGESATYNGYTYSVNQLPKIVKDGLTYDAVEVVFSGGLNVHDDINDPLRAWYLIDNAPTNNSVVVKYMCDGAPILKDGVDIRVNSQGEWGSTFTYNYLDNPKFDSTMASKYTLLKGYVEQPAMLTDQGETVSVVISQSPTVIVFEFNKLGAYVQFHRQSGPVANPVYETPEPYGNAHHATVAANDPTDAGKVIKVLITDDIVGYEAQGKFIGAGQSATYHGYTYYVNQLPKIVRCGLTYDAVEVVISEGLNVHDDINDPLVIWYQMI